MNTGSNPDSAILLKKPEVQERLVEIRDSNEHSTWGAVRDEFNKEHNSDVSMSAIKGSYNKTIAMSIKISGPAQQHFSDMFPKMAERLNNITIITDTLADELKNAIHSIRSARDLDPLQKTEAIMELVPRLDKINTSIMKQLTFVSSQMNQITIEQKKSMWDDNKLKIEMDRMQPLRLQILEDEEKIAVIDRSLLEQ